MKYYIENINSNYKDEVDKIITDRQDEIFNFFNSSKVGDFSKIKVTILDLKFDKNKTTT